MSSKPIVYFTKTITPEKILDMYKILNFTLPGKVGVKVHTGEKGNTNFIRPEYFKPVVDYLNGTILETNTSGPISETVASRNTTERHKQLLIDHGWTKYYSKIDILDGEGPDEVLEIPKGFILKKNYIGKNTKNYDSLLVISHFKGHGSGGYGGALKQLSVGFGSSAGKTYQHSAGTCLDQNKILETMCGVKEFKECMADAASSITEIFKNKIAYINIMMNISVDCDCNRNPKPPCMKDIGILSSLDPVAIDQACVDLVYNSDDPGKKELIERIESKMGLHTLECAEQLGVGKREYKLVNVD